MSMHGDIRERVLHATDITPFQRRVYLELLNVPRGETISYGELARRIWSITTSLYPKTRRISKIFFRQLFFF